MKRTAFRMTIESVSASELENVHWLCISGQSGAICMTLRYNHVLELNFVKVIINFEL